MINLPAMLAAAAPDPAASPRPWYVDFLASPLSLMLIVLVIFYVVMIRSKRRQDRQRQEMLDSLKKGDRVQTIGGILGTVVETRDDEVVVKVDESSNTKIRFTRSAIHRVLEAEKPQPR